VVEEDDDEVHALRRPLLAQLVVQPPGLLPARVAEVGGDLVRHVVGVQRHEADVAVGERVHARRVVRVEAAVRQGEAGQLAAVALR
jgi:hypothetical protein